MNPSGTSKSAAHTADDTKPCPFCGSSNISDGEILSSDADGGNRATQSQCMNCGADGPRAALAQDELDYGGDKARAAWNRRTAPDQPTKDRA